MSNSKKGGHPAGKPAANLTETGAAWRWISERGMRMATGELTLARYEMLSSLGFPEIEDMVPADGNLLLVFRRGKVASAELLAALAAPLPNAQATRGASHTIAVEYGGTAGADLYALAQQAGMDIATYIERHSAVEYTVAFLGFQPGFPYLRGLPPALHAPRRATPRVRVPAGSVAIGGDYCGVYPAGGPGGWHIIGRTDAVLFDPQRPAPALLLPGDRVRFVPR